VTQTSSDRPGSSAARIAVDLLGGDDAPAVVVDGALAALRDDPDIALLLVGPAPTVDGARRRLDPALRDRVAGLPVPRAVAMSDPAVRGTDPGTSIGAAIGVLAEGGADAFVSAGSTGAIVAASVLGLRRQHGVRRPALTAILPGAVRPLVLLDVGAGMQISAAELVQYAALGAAYAQLVVGIAQPRVGLLSVGHEVGKGDRLRRAADAWLRAQPVPGGAYVGLVEGNDAVLGDRADVIVTDGFTGNVLLKGIEAALLTAEPDRLGEWAPPERVPRAAALLGVAGAVVVCHGAAAAPDICSGILLAARLARVQVADHLAAPTRDDRAAPAQLAEVVL
jgi:glycerol-3-phosphate acyltransferase PlsX